ncbi:MAG: T9SS type A sorting domain-containing protein [Segetibacter sp.]
MKKLLLLSLCITLISLVSHATIHVVQVANFQFIPADVPNVTVGDTMRWVWVSGNHTTTDNPVIQTGNVLPAGAPAWDAPINATNTTFDYKVTVAGTYNYWCKPHRPNMAASFTASAALPIKLSSLGVSGSNGKVVVNWKTITEQNTDYFSVRRSLNGSTYTEIAKIPAAGNSNTEKLYSFTDADINSGKYYYYNLAVVDKDGSQEFTETKLFKGERAISKLVLSLSPNPISRPGHLMMTFNANKEGNMDVNVINAQGQRVIKTQMQAYQGVNNGHVHLGNLPQGTYTLICTLDGIKETHQIIFK